MTPPAGRCPSPADGPQPRAAVGVGERLAGDHLGDVVRRVQVITVAQEAERVSEQHPDGGLAVETPMMTMW